MKKAYLLAVMLFGACGADSALDTLPDSTLAFAPQSISLQRFTNACTPQADQPFLPTDQLQFVVTGAPPDTPDVNQQQLLSVISLSIHPTLPKDQDLVVDLGDFFETSVGTSNTGSEVHMHAQYGMLPLENNSFGWQQGLEINELDDEPLASVSVRIEEVPAAEGEPGTVVLRMEFTDGNVYDVRLTAPVTTGFVGCPVGDQGSGDGKL